MAIEPVSAIKTTQALSRFGKQLTSHNFTKASFDAPIESELTAVNLQNVKANFFPYDSSIGKIEENVKDAAKDVANESEIHKFVSQTALACEFPIVNP